MMLQKSIRSYGQLVQDQFKQLLSSPELKGRIMLGSTEDFEWQQLSCIVPIKCPVFRPEDLTTVRILIRFNVYRFPMTPGLYIDSNLIPSQIRFINITEDMVESERIKTVKEVVVEVVKQIDSYGLLKWAQKTYEAHLSYNKMNQKIHQVNQNQLIQQKSNINVKMEKQKNKTTQLQSLGTNLQLLSTNKQYYYNKSLNSAFRFKNYEQEQQSKIYKQENQTPELVVNKGFRELSQNSHKACKIEQQGKPKDDKTNSDQNPCLRNFNNYVKMEDSLHDGNRMFSSPFSCFKPVSQNSLKGLKNTSGCEKNIVKIQTKRNEEFLKIPSFGFMPCASNLSEKEPEESISKSFKGNSEKLQENLKAEVFSVNEYPHSMVSSAGDKHGKHPKPMNKNANLPKFLIRIFIKYVDKFKQMYVKKQYDRLYAECKKMKEWKKNDRRQHAFGLKHLKIFFQDAIEGFPDPKLNRRVISRIIDNFLLEEICQNSQIPQSHRVGLFNPLQKRVSRWPNPIKVIEKEEQSTVKGVAWGNN